MYDIRSYGFLGVFCFSIFWVTWFSIYSVLRIWSNGLALNQGNKILSLNINKQQISIFCDSHSNGVYLLLWEMTYLSFSSFLLNLNILRLSRLASFVSFSKGILFNKSFQMRVQKIWSQFYLLFFISMSQIQMDVVALII